MIMWLNQRRIRSGDTSMGNTCCSSSTVGPRNTTRQGILLSRPKHAHWDWYLVMCIMQCWILVICTDSIAKLSSRIATVWGTSTTKHHSPVHLTTVSKSKWSLLQTLLSGSTLPTSLTLPIQTSRVATKTTRTTSTTVEPSLLLTLSTPTSKASPRFFYSIIGISITSSFLPGKLTNNSYNSSHLFWINIFPIKILPTLLPTVYNKKYLSTLLIYLVMSPVFIIKHNVTLFSQESTHLINIYV